MVLIIYGKSDQRRDFDVWSGKGICLDWQNQQI